MIVILSGIAGVVGGLLFYGLPGVAIGLIIVGAIAMLIVLVSLARSLRAANQKLAAQPAPRTEEHGTVGAPESGSEAVALSPAKEEEKLGSVQIAKAESTEGLAAINSAVEAVSAGDPGHVRDALAEWINAANDAAQRQEREALMLSLQVDAGSHTALAELQRLVDENRDNISSLLLLSEKLISLGEERRAIAVLEGHLNDLDRNDRGVALLELSRLRRQVGDFEAAVIAARKAIESGAERWKCLWAIGAAFQGARNAALALVQYEQAIELAPTEADLRYQAAHLYSELGLNDLAAFHYFYLVQSSPRHVYGLNNLGVALERLHLEIGAVSNYKRAVELGESLPAGNLATILINGGFADEARDWIKRGQETEDVHPQVIAASSNLVRKAENETVVWDELVKRVRDVRDVVMTFLDQKTNLPTGDWALADGVAIRFVASGGRAVGDSTNPSNPLHMELDHMEGVLAVAVKVGTWTGTGVAVTKPNENQMIGWIHNWPIRDVTSPFSMRPIAAAPRVVTK